jgi:hypothetical protein
MPDRAPRNADEVESRRQLVALAASLLAGQLSYLEGAPQVQALLRKVGGVDDRDPDFDAFVLISSETDHLPLQKHRGMWSPSALERLEPQFRRVEEWARGFAPKACESLIARFTIHDS